MITTEIRLGTVDSTMEAAKSLAASQDFILVSAEAQTKGRGTRGRVWQSPPGNVYMTLGIHRRHLPPDRLALLPLEMGLCLREAVASLAPEEHRPHLSLKWPNDLLFRGAKAAGILMESHGDFILIGIGVNVAGAPPMVDGGSPTVCLAEAGIPPENRDSLVEGIYRRMREAFRQPADFEAETILLRWQAKVDWSRRHRLRDREGTPSVLPLGINVQGHLHVEHDDGSREWLVSEYLA
jgi:BirA family biotin operon repressor/biotin-[acetyl-CoA-carboxylase] ligase